MIYRVEISDENQADRFEIISQNEDYEAVKEAIYLCKDENVGLLEMHEIDDNYDNIRYIDIDKVIDMKVTELKKQYLCSCCGEVSTGLVYSAYLNMMVCKTCIEDEPMTSDEDYTNEIERDRV